MSELSPEDRRKVLRGGVGVLVALAGVLAWSLLAAPEAPAVAQGHTAAPLVSTPEAKLVTAETVALDPATRPAANTIRRVLELAIGRRVPGLFGLQLGYLRTNDFLGTIPFSEVIRGTPSVKVVNLWAVWCEPCVREMTMFRELSDTWRRDIKFVPIHVSAVEDRAAYRRIVDLMPVAAVEPLIDSSGHAVLDLLGDTGLVEFGEGIPITFLLDCRNELRWLHVGGLLDTTALAERLTALRGELGGPRCAIPEPTPVAQPGLPGCGDGSCDHRSEHCGNCSADCGCIVGTECRILPGTPPTCVVPDSAFKDP